MTSVGHMTFNSNAVLPVSESGVKYAICSAHLDMFPLNKITYLTPDSETGKTALHVTFNSNAVLPVSESGVIYVILFSRNISR